MLPGAPRTMASCWMPEEVRGLITQRSFFFLFFSVAVIAVVSQPTCASGVGAVPHLSTGTQDEQLRAMVKQQGARRWKIIAAALPNKSAIQCMHRWQKVHP